MAILLTVVPFFAGQQAYAKWLDRYENIQPSGKPSVPKYFPIFSLTPHLISIDDSRVFYILISCSDRSDPMYAMTAVCMLSVSLTAHNRSLHKSQL